MRQPSTSLLNVFTKRVLAQVLAMLGVVASFGLASGEAHADDGVIEINRAVVESGSLGGDSPGFPLTLTQAGSYRLTENLDMLALGTVPSDVIQITGDDISLDLNGFRLECHRPTIPTRTLCKGLNTFSNGVIVQGSNVEIKNGTIRGMAGDGIDASFSTNNGLMISNIRSVDNGFDGIAIRGASQVWNSQFHENGSYGINLFSGGNVQLRGVLSTGNNVGLRMTGVVFMGDSTIQDGYTGASIGNIYPYTCNYIMDGQAIFTRCP